MTNAISRAQFIRGDFSGKHRYIRPPWSLHERAFIGNCNRCHACITACPEHLLSRDPKGFPQLDFSRGECTFCSACTEACDTDALDPKTSTTPWTLTAAIGGKCLPLRGVVCGRCAEECAAGAIGMRLVAGGITIPRLEHESCTGCGACFRACPVSAIEFRYGANP